MMTRSRFVLLLFAVTLMAGCASTPGFETRGVDTSLSPRHSITQMSTVQGKQVLWGGMIVASTNLKDMTQLEILAYPLDSSQRPAVEEQSMGRFLAMYPGYLETADYTQGRLITIKGTLSGTQLGKIGESEYTYPVVNIQQKYLWPKGSGVVSQPRIHFGIGVMIRN
jgi:outer membrane lipoprotein